MVSFFTNKKSSTRYDDTKTTELGIQKFIPVFVKEALLEK